MANRNINPKMKVIDKIIFWTPRVLAIMFILFLSLFSLDIFDGNYGFWGTIIGLFMHNIPSLVLLAILIISWKYEIVGGVAFILAGLLYVSMIAVSVSKDLSNAYQFAWTLPISEPAFLVGGLFLAGWIRKKKRE